MLALVHNLEQNLMVEADITGMNSARGQPGSNLRNLLTQDDNRLFEAPV
jgi:hypothetical protein